MAGGVTVDAMIVATSVVGGAVSESLPMFLRHSVWGRKKGCKKYAREPGDEMHENDILVVNWDV
jgi:hypothetical protein